MGRAMSNAVVPYTITNGLLSSPEVHDAELLGVAFQGEPGSSDMLLRVRL
jgi:hypothetical protein